MKEKAVIKIVNINNVPRIEFTKDLLVDLTKVYFPKLTDKL
jgi:hypothetical protein